MGYRSTFSLSLLYIKSCLALFFYSKTLCAQNVIYKLKCIKFQTSTIQKASTSNNDKYLKWMKGQVPIYGSAGTLKQGWKRRQVSLLEDCGNFLIQMRRQMTFWRQNSASRSLCLLKASLYALKQCGLWGGDPLLPHINMKQKNYTKGNNKIMFEWHAGSSINHNA